MQPEISQAIEEVVTEVMEQMAFIFVDPADKDAWPAHTDELLQVTLAFGGAGQGHLTLAATRDLAMEVATNLAGDDDLKPEVGEQALMELANVICGRLLTQVAGEAPVFDLEPPQLTVWDPPDAREAMAQDGMATFLADDQPIFVRFQISAVAADTPR